ncbi:GntR family transcriptional regulator [Paenibacillus naphthalenovorans]|uniref:GntR family transcriptional regulator n=1 Tax=Paenibacillus naphthalenovorans TaxID=162209 RepID=UPI003D2DAA47
MNPINNQSTRLVSLKDEIKQKLREDIISNTLKPGQRIVETEIAKNHGISQVPVREALRGLEEEGLVKTVKYKGAFVTEINQVELYHIFSLRTEIETSVLEIVVPKLTRRDTGELYDIVEKMKSGTPDYLTQSGFDMDFHSKIIEWSQIEIYNRVWGILNTHIRRYIAYFHPTIQIKPEEVYKYHLELVEVLEQGDVEKSKAAFREHIMSFCNETRIK